MKINFVARCAVPDDVLRDNIRHCNGLSLPRLGEAGPVAPRLAVVGGGPSVADHIDELKSFDGDIWAINGAMRWCGTAGIDAALFTIDPKQSLSEVAGEANRAILGSSCHPDVFKAVRGPIEVFRFGEWDSGSTTASTAPMAAAMRGHAKVILFGCESSFTTQLHAYPWSDQNRSRVVVECGGMEYLTTPQLIMQAEYISELARGVPGFIEVRGDGFLPALIEHGDYDVLKVSRDVMESLNGNH